MESGERLRGHDVREHERWTAAIARYGIDQVAISESAQAKNSRLRPMPRSQCRLRRLASVAKDSLLPAAVVNQ